MAKVKNKKKKQVKKLNSDVMVIGMIIISILLAVLIYGETGYVGKTLSPLLGGVFGVVKFLIPLGTFAIGIYLVYDDKEYLTSKLLQYAVVILCICTVMCIYQQSLGNINADSRFC